MESFHDLQKSAKFQDQIIYDFYIRFLDKLFGKHDLIIIETGCENKENQDLIKDQWKVLEFHFKIPKRIKSTQKCVRQTLKHLVHHLNNTYQFKKPIQFNPQRETIRLGLETFAKTYTILKLT